jgi:hypothetical protein
LLQLFRESHEGCSNVVVICARHLHLAVCSPGREATQINSNEFPFNDRRSAIVFAEEQKLQEALTAKIAELRTKGSRASRG